MVYGSSPIACVLEECKAQHSGKGEQQQHRTSLDPRLVQHECTFMGEINEQILQLLVFTVKGFPLYEVHQIMRATTGEPTLLE